MPNAGFLLGPRGEIIGSPGIAKERPALSFPAAVNLANQLNAGRDEHSRYEVVGLRDRQFVIDDVTVFVANVE